MTSSRLLLRRRPGPMVPALLAGLMAALFLAVPMPAQAHDTLVASDPEDGATLEESPESITLTYNAEILDITPVVRLSDADGEVVQETTPTIDARDAVAEIEEPLAAGEYTVDWRVVSSDGHPIEGTFTFTVTSGADGEQDEASPQQPAPSDNGGRSDTQAAQGAEEGSRDSAMLPLLVGVGILVVLVLGAVFFLGRRRKD